MKELQEDFSKTTLDPKVRKAFAKVNKFLTDIEYNVKSKKVPDTISKILGELSPVEKQGFIKIIKSLTLLTSGNVEMVRNRGKTWDRKKAQRWERVASPVSLNVLNLLNLFLD